MDEAVEADGEVDADEEVEVNADKEVEVETDKERRWKRTRGKRR